MFLPAGWNLKNFEILRQDDFHLFLDFSFFDQTASMIVPLQISLECQVKTLDWGWLMSPTVH